VVDNVMTIVDPDLIKIIVKEGEVVGFVFPFPDVSAAMQKNKGKLGPIEILRLLNRDQTHQLDFFQWGRDLARVPGIWAVTRSCMLSLKNRCIRIRSLSILS
jgi:hypothetical protein